MHWLAVESATLTASVAVGKRDKVLAEMTSQAALTHSERLLPMVDQTLGLAQLDLDAIGSVVVSIGPGSFTGLRIGLATVKGLAHARPYRLYGVSTLDALAWQQPEGIVVSLLDARREQVYAAIYRRRTDSLETLLAPTAIGLQELLADHLPAGAAIRFVGQGADVYRDQIEQQVAHALFANPLHNWPRASSLAQVAYKEQRPPFTAAELRPQYLRESAAKQRQEQAKVGGSRHV